MTEFAALYQLMPFRQRRLFFVTLVLMLTSAAAEMVTIGSVLPFLALAMDPQTEIIPPRLAETLVVVGGSPVAGAAVVLIVAAMSAAAIRVVLAGMSQKLVAAAGTDLAAAALARSLRLPYQEQVRRHSGRTLSMLEQVQPVVTGVLMPTMQGLIAAVIALFLTLLLLLIDAFAAALGAAVGVLIYAVVSLATRPVLRRNARTLTDAAAKRTRIVQEGLGGIRDILIARSQDAVEARFREVDWRFRRAQGFNSVLVSTPRFVVEAAGIAVIATIALGISARPGEIAVAVPMLGALALGAQRLLPLLQTIYQAWGQTTGNFDAFRQLIATATTPLPANGDEAPALRNPLHLSDSVELIGVGFRFPASSATLRDVSLRIRRGEHLGITGPSGAGKSTLVDLITGLLDADEGEIRIDGERLDSVSRLAWQSAIGHVPQVIFLFDDTIVANITFPHPPAEVPSKAIADVIRTARVDEFLAMLPDGLETRVGERGVRLSAGQRQKIGLARALLRHPSLLILDEATSALDEVSEAAVLDSIRLQKGLTVISVAHRASALARCDRVVLVADGRVKTPLRSAAR